jgi:hypothetical protein
MALYINNSLESTDTQAKGVLYNATPANGPYLGYATSTSTYTNADWDDFRLFNTELSEEERNFIYNAGNGTEDDVSTATTGFLTTNSKFW